MLKQAVPVVEAEFLEDPDSPWILIGKESNALIAKSLDMLLEIADGLRESAFDAVRKDI
jgi:hypothetical protein